MQWAQLVVFGITTGMIYALIGLGWGLVYNMTGVLNIAQGEFVMVGGLATGVLMATYDLSLLTAGLISIAIVLALAAVIQFLSVEVVRKRSRVAPVLVTLAAVFVISDVARRVFGSDAVSGRPLVTGTPVSLPFDVTVPVRLLPVWALTLCVFASFAFFNRTRYGKLMRASAEDPRGARLMGVNPVWMSRAAFLLAGLVGAVTGIFLLTIIPIGFESGLSLGLKGFIALAVVGMARPLGALAGGLILGILESLVAGYVSSQWAEVAAFGVLIVVLLFLPSGILGQRRISMPAFARRPSPAV